MKRIQDSLTARSERVVLIWLTERLPGWVTSDMLTALGVAGAGLCFVGFWMSDRGTPFLWLAVVGLMLNWFGDSLDGTLARQRQAERPRYGFFLDHMTDTFAMGLVAIGVGLSPFVELSVGMAALLGYYVLVIQSLITSQATGVFRISFNGLGPTEIRLFIIVCTIACIFLPIPRFGAGGVELSIYDAIVMVAVVLMIVMCVMESIKTLRVLAVEDPPRR